MRAMRRRLLIAALGLWVAAAARPASAQILADGPVVYGHHHLNVTSVEATKKFLVDALGGTAIRIGENRAEVVRFPNVLIFMRAQAPKGGSKGNAKQPPKGNAKKGSSSRSSKPSPKRGTAPGNQLKGKKPEEDSR